ncbi:EndoU domain-containing protein [Cutibacterium sp.]|uniref:EndoU domain-containing protein n=1 Tax=Cutibacterium sp. TaxID=1912221 RepID=UPI0026DC07D0|nr:EndoU domain-containing protein [Cutibacterium sp.]MDO4413062.1 EndoU domain-containing protein [Cutibacterium sp.]
MSGGDTFPQDWGPDQIQQAIADVIKDGQYTYEKPGRAFYTGNKDGITIRVNVNPDEKLVLSAYPVGS